YRRVEHPGSRLPPSQPMPNVGRRNWHGSERDVKQGTTLSPKMSLKLGGRLYGGAGPRSHCDLDQAGDVSPFMPGMEGFELVCAKNPYILRIAGQATHGIDSVCLAATVYFHGVDVQGRLVAGRELQHGQAMRSEERRVGTCSRAPCIR